MKEIKPSKTKQAIFNAFYSLRKKYPIEKIKVTDICKSANINRTTFYDYFEDIYDLSSDYERFLIDDCFKLFKNKEDFYKNPSMFVEEFRKAINLHKEDFNILGKGREKELLYNIENKVDEMFEKDLDRNDKKYLFVFLSGGFFHTIEKHVVEKHNNFSEIEDQLDLLLIKILNIHNI